jgi:hypothetical protein
LGLPITDLEPHPKRIFTPLRFKTDLADAKRRPVEIREIQASI